jgi:hypothetical protein
MTPAEAVVFMKQNKILHFRQADGLELTLVPEALATPGALPEPETDTGPDMNVRGLGGQTRQEQLDLLGMVYEADFPQKRA